jgi:hypothetical protein
MIYGDTEKSYQKTAKLINRIRHQEQGGTPHRTLHECTEKEGENVLSYIEEKTSRILVENGFSEDGICQDSKADYNNDKPATIPKEQAIEAIDKCRQDKDICVEDILSNSVPYEDPGKSINVAIDDVNVKKQEELRLGGRKPERGKRNIFTIQLSIYSKKMWARVVINFEIIYVTYYSGNSAPSNGCFDSRTNRKRHRFFNRNSRAPVRVGK